MKNSLLKKHKRRRGPGTAPTEKRVITSVFITRDQLDFLSKNEVNLSSLVREFLDSIMKGAKNGTK